MLRHKILLLLASLAITVLTTLAALPSQEQNGSRSPKQESTEADLLPVVDYESPEPDDPEKRALQKVRGSRYTRGNKQLIKELPLGIEELPLTTHWWWGIPAIPVENSDVIVIGEVVDAQAHLSNDKTAVYSEFTVNNEEVFKNNRSTPLSNTISVERFGGAVRFRSGRIQHYRIEKQGLPQVGHRYLLFLRSIKGSQDFSVLTGYELSAGWVVALDSAGSNPNSKLPFDYYDGCEESAFFNQLRNAIANSSSALPEKGRQN